MEDGTHSRPGPGWLLRLHGHVQTCTDVHRHVQTQAFVEIGRMGPEQSKAAFLFSRSMSTNFVQLNFVYAGDSSTTALLPLPARFG